MTGPTNADWWWGAWGRRRRFPRRNNSAAEAEPPQAVVVEEFGFNEHDEKLNTLIFSHLVADTLQNGWQKESDLQLNLLSLIYCHMDKNLLKSWPPSALLASRRLVSRAPSRWVGLFFFRLFCARKHQTLKLISRVNRFSKKCPRTVTFPASSWDCDLFTCWWGQGGRGGHEYRHTCVADAAILSCPCLVSVPMSLWLMVNRASPSMPLSRVSGTAPDTLLRRLLAGGTHIVRERRASSQGCSPSCPFPGVVGRCRRACWSPHPSSPWPPASACASPASRRWTTVWSRPPWHCTKTSGRKGAGAGRGEGVGGWEEQRGWGGGVNALAFKWFWRQRVSTVWKAPPIP